MGGDSQWLGEPGTGKSDRIRKASAKLPDWPVPLSKKQKKMGMNGIPIVVDSGWLARVTDNHVKLFIDYLMLEKMLLSEGIVIGDIVAYDDEGEEL